MSGLELSKHPRWPLYRKVRRHVALELRSSGKPHTDLAVDACLAVELRAIAEDLLRLYIFDVSGRGARERVRNLFERGALDPSVKPPQS